jgi:hypothetical protein
MRKKELLIPRELVSPNQYDVLKKESQKSEKEIFAVRWNWSLKKMQKKMKTKKKENLLNLQNNRLLHGPTTPDKWKNMY